MRFFYLTYFNNESIHNFFWIFGKQITKRKYELPLWSRPFLVSLPVCYRELCCDNFWFADIKKNDRLMTIVINDRNFWSKIMWSDLRRLALGRFWYFEDEFWNKTSVCVTLPVQVLHCFSVWDTYWNNFTLSQQIHVYCRLVLIDCKVPQPRFFSMSQSRPRDDRDEIERYDLQNVPWFLQYIIFKV